VRGLGIGVAGTHCRVVNKLIIPTYNRQKKTNREQYDAFDDWETMSAHMCYVPVAVLREACCTLWRL
jgi:hypothetical protein